MKSLGKFRIMLVALSIVFCLSCEEQNKEDAPQLPPESSLIMNFSDFTTKEKSALVDTSLSNHFAHAGVQVFVWNVIITVGMAIPVASFVEAFKHEAIQESTGHWKWSYNFKVGGILHKAELHGIISDSITWEMYITKEGFYDNFLWYQGKNDLLVTGGYWIMQKSPDENIELLQIDWNRNITDSTGSISYTNIEPGGAENGGYISYGKTLNEPFNSYYNIYNKGQDNLVNIEWHDINKDGRVKNKKWFLYQDTEWHCWDTNLKK